MLAWPLSGGVLLRSSASIVDRLWSWKLLAVSILERVGWLWLVLVWVSLCWFDSRLGFVGLFVNVVHLLWIIVFRLVSLICISKIIITHPI